jgi:hypothetical protein
MQYLAVYIVPAVVILLSLPMILGKVPPNRFYGFRTPKTLSSPDIWYRANRASGWYMIAASLFSLCVNTVLLLVSPDWSIRWLPALSIVPLLLSLLASLIYLRRLQ